MINGISETQTAYTGYFNNELIKKIESGKIPSWKEEKIMEKYFERENEKIQQVYDAQGKLVENNDSGRHLNFFA